MALVLPVMLLFILGIMEYGRWLMTEHVFNNAVRTGAVYAAKHGSPVAIDDTSGTAVTYGNASSDVTNAVTSDLFGQQLGGQNISVFCPTTWGTTRAWPGGQPGQYVCVTITGSYSFLIPKLLGLPASLSTQFTSVQPSEGN